MRAAFRNYGEGRKRKTSEERARDLVRAVNIYRRRLKSKAIAYKGGKCVLCGYDKCTAALEFHHLDRKIKSFGLSKRGLTRSWVSTRAELDKCILVCSNCHREIEAGMRAIPEATTKLD